MKLILSSNDYILKYKSDTKRTMYVNMYNE
jgi:hypothetical protein